MKLSDLVPSSDLLEKFEGLESGLSRRRRLGRFGKIGVMFAFLAWLSDITPLFHNWAHDWLSLLNSPWKQLVTIGLVAALVFIFLAVLYSFWLKESRRPVRYTCSLGYFSPVLSDDSKPATLVKEELNWLRHDIAQRLNQVGRLMFFFSTEAGTSAQSSDKETEKSERPSSDQHIHIEGTYYFQDKSLGKSKDEVTNPDWELVVMPRVRIGRTDGPEQLAKPVYHALGTDTTLSEKKYNDLVEHVYFNIVSEVYQQIREDVERKISLLPTRRHKAVAFYHEAEDYARSNTLRAYEEASQLYLEASRHFEPFNPLINPFPKSRFLKLWCSLDTLVDSLARKLLRLSYLLRPDMARHELLATRAKLSYANMLIFRFQLAYLLGHRPLPMYVARPFAKQALDSAIHLPRDVTRQSDDKFSRKCCLFDAHVTNALVCSLLGDDDKSRHHLDQAKSIDPPRATTSAVYLHAESLLPALPQQKYEWLVRAVEQDGTFEVAKFHKAYAREMRWRRASHPTTMWTEASLVIEEYSEVLKVNPSNIGAAANAAFVLWALKGQIESDKAKDFNRAKVFLNQALRYNELAPETVVVEHHYGLARIFAEQGEFEKAYEHLVKAEDGRRAHRGTHSIDPGSYLFAYVSDDLRRRYNSYRKRVARHASRFFAHKVKLRAIKVVCAFVHDEYGSACLSYYHRVSRDRRHWNLAVRAFEKAIDSDNRNVLAHYHFAQVATTAQERYERLEKVLQLDPNWEEAIRELAVAKAEESRGKEEDAKALDELAGTFLNLLEQIKKLEQLGANEEQVDRADSAYIERSHQRPVPEKLKEIQKRKDETKKRIKELMAKLPKTRHGREALESEVEKAQREALALRKQASEPWDEVRKRARALLPHDWLWLSDGHEASDFNWRCLHDARFRKEARWEREFETVHAIALYHWTNALLSQGGAVPESSRYLLHHIRQTFLPADVDVLLTCQRAENDKQDIEELKQQGGRIVNGWLLADPTDRVNLDWVDNSGISIAPDDLLDRLTTAKQAGLLPHHLLRYLAFKPFEEGNRQYGLPNNIAKAAESYERVLVLNADGAETPLAAGRLATLLFADNKLMETEPLLEKSLSQTYSLLPSAAKEPDGDVEKFLSQNELARIEMKVGYERRLRAATDRSVTDAVMGLLRIRSGEEERSTEYNNVRTPLIVEWDEALLPQDVNNFLINQAAPWVRQRVEEHYGVAVPGIRFRATPEGARPGLYRILDHEVVVEEDIASGRVSLLAPRSEESWQDPLWFTMERLEAYLEAHLAQWIRTQEVQRLLELNCQDLYHASIPDSIPEFETHNHIGPLTIVIRSLVAERVPILEFSRIYKLYRSLWDAGEHVQTITREIRRNCKVKPHLWGNAQQYRRFILSARAEDELQNACETIDGFTVLDMPPERRGQVVSALTAGMGQEHRSSLTVRCSMLRPLVRRLIESKLPNIPVLAEDELECQVRAIGVAEITVPAAEQQHGIKI